MPSCSILVCGNRSNVTNYQTCGVTYHRFPKCSKMKQKWIEATGRDNNWFPRQHSAICSSHFEDQSFLPSVKSRRLFATAVPTLKLRLVFETPSTKSKKRKILAKKTIIKPKKNSTISELNAKIDRFKHAMKVQLLRIKRLQTMVRRYRKKVGDMKNILETLKNENVIGEDHLWLMEL